MIKVGMAFVINRMREDFRLDFRDQWQALREHWTEPLEQVQ